MKAAVGPSKLNILLNPAILTTIFTPSGEGPPSVPTMPVLCPSRQTMPLCILQKAQPLFDITTLHRPVHTSSRRIYHPTRHRPSALTIPSWPRPKLQSKSSSPPLFRDGREETSMNFKSSSPTPTSPKRTASKFPKPITFEPLPCVVMPLLHMSNIYPLHAPDIENEDSILRRKQHPSLSTIYTLLLVIRFFQTSTAIPILLSAHQRLSFSFQPPTSRFPFDFRYTTVYQITPLLNRLCNLRVYGLSSNVVATKVLKLPLQLPLFLLEN
jgi:hypothetical protein